METSILNYWSQMNGWEIALNAAPLGLLLALAALLPLNPKTSDWWEDPRHKAILCALFALGGVLVYCVPTQDFSRVFQTYLDYSAFLMVMASLFVVSGGIRLEGGLAGTPGGNSLFLLLGAVLSNWLGTTGASMLLIRPFLRMNRRRSAKTHLAVFFIFIVSNAGQFLPLGPPMYLGYLKGVPFLWNLYLVPPFALWVGMLLLLFYGVDCWIARNESWMGKGQKKASPFRLEGWPNVGWLLLIVAGILFSGYGLIPALVPGWGETGAEAWSKGFQVLWMGGIALLSYRNTSSAIHRKNQFHFAPILEVAVLFFGIFGAMIPALALLEAKWPALPLNQPWEFFWASGLFSSILDNAPTYLNFTVLAASQQGIAPSHLGQLAAGFPRLLAAISCGASFMGALTYIGNGPNLLVKAVAEGNGVKMPSFGGYILWSLVLLTPVFLVETLIFFR